MLLSFHHIIFNWTNNNNEYAFIILSSGSQVRCKDDRGTRLIKKYTRPTLPFKLSESTTTSMYHCQYIETENTNKRQGTVFSGGIENKCWSSKYNSSKNNNHCPEPLYYNTLRYFYEHFIFVAIFYLFWFS